MFRTDDNWKQQQWCSENLKKIKTNWIKVAYQIIRFSQLQGRIFGVCFQINIVSSTTSQTGNCGTGVTRSKHLAVIHAVQKQLNKITNSDTISNFCYLNYSWIIQFTSCELDPLWTASLFCLYLVITYVKQTSVQICVQIVYKQVYKFFFWSMAYIINWDLNRFKLDVLSILYVHRKFL